MIRIALTLLLMAGIACPQPECVNIDRRYFMRLVAAESGWNAEAEHPDTGCLGLTQLNPLSFPDYTRQELLDPVRNLRLGAQYLAEQVDEFGGYFTAGVAYVWGPQNVRWAKRRYGLNWARHAPVEAYDYSLGLMRRRREE